MIKKTIIMSLLLIMIFSNNIYAESLNDNYYILKNPTNNNTVIVDKTGKILLRGITNESEIGIINDIFTKEAKYLYKKSIGKNLILQKWNNNNGDESTWNEPSVEGSFYDLNGKKLFDLDDFYYVNGFGNNCILYANDKGCTIYNVDTGDSIFKDYARYQALNNRLVAFTNYSGNVNQTIEILNNEFVVENKYDGYTLLYDIDNTNLYLVSKEIGEDKYLYNFLTKEGTFLFEKDFENKINSIGNDKIMTFVSGNEMFKYDIIKNEYVSTPSIITNDEKEKIMLELSNDIFARTLNDDNKKKIAEKYGKDFSSVLKYTYKDKIVYSIAVDEYEVISTDSKTNEESYNYTYFNDIYDENCNLIKSKVEQLNSSLTDFGYFESIDTIYDFDFNEVFKFNDDVNLAYYSIDDKLFFVDKYDKYYRTKTNQILYDANFNILFNNLTSVDFCFGNKLIILKDNISSKIYDKNLNLVKDLKRRITIKDISFNNLYVIFQDDLTARYGILKNDGSILIDKYKNITFIYDDYFVYQNGFKYGIMDFKKNKIFDISIFDDMREDANVDDYTIGYVVEYSDSE